MEIQGYSSALTGFSTFFSFCHLLLSVEETKDIILWNYNT